MIRSLVDPRWMELIFRMDRNRKKRRMGNKIVSKTRANTLALMMGWGMNRGDFEK